ncbi:MAG: YggT family protein [Myxococcota bacterium]|nr:YggT family protein [Myxococcota bacterium]
MYLIGQVIDLIVLFLFVDVILSWVLRPHQFPLNYTRQLTEPMYAPVRQLLDPRRTGGLDLSPLVWIFGLQILGGMLGV